MTQDITTTGPSRRSIAKGAAWAVPAVSVAAAAPSLAASVVDCEPGTLSISVRRCSFVGLGSAPYFTITNPSADCEIPVGANVDLNFGSLVGLELDFLDSANTGLSAFYVIGNVHRATLLAPLGPGQSMNVLVYNSSALSVGLGVGTQVNLTVNGVTEGFNWTKIRLGLLNVFSCVDL